MNPVCNRSIIIITNSYGFIALHITNSTFPLVENFNHQSALIVNKFSFHYILRRGLRFSFLRKTII